MPHKLPHVYTSFPAKVKKQIKDALDPIVDGYLRDEGIIKSASTYKDMQEQFTKDFPDFNYARPIDGEAETKRGNKYIKDLKAHRSELKSKLAKNTKKKRAVVLKKSLTEIRTRIKQAIARMEYYQSMLKAREHLSEVRANWLLLESLVYKPPKELPKKKTKKKKG